jgi:hypothetical protein
VGGGVTMPSVAEIAPQTGSRAIALLKKLGLC